MRRDDGKEEVYLRLPPLSKERLDSMAKCAGKTNSEYVQELVEREFQKWLDQ